MVSLRTDAECPSLSPDQTRIAYKKRLESKARGIWRLAVLDLRTGQESLLAETRSVDDQGVARRNRLLYGLPRPGRGDDLRRLGGTGRRTGAPTVSFRRHPHRRWSGEHHSRHPRTDHCPEPTGATRSSRLAGMPGACGQWIRGECDLPERSWRSEQTAD